MTAVSDNFNRADGGLGANWDTQTGQSPAQIVGNRVEVVAANDDEAQNYVQTLGNDQYSQLTITTITGNSGIGYTVGPILRASTTAFDFYLFRALRNQPTTTEIYKAVGGSFTLLASEAAITWLANDVIYARAIGTNLMLNRNGVTVLSASDSALFSGRAGFRINTSSGGTPSNLNFDNWAAGDFVNLSFRDFPKPKIRDAVRAGWIA